MKKTITPLIALLILSGLTLNACEFEPEDDHNDEAEPLHDVDPRLMPQEEEEAAEEAEVEEVTPAEAPPATEETSSSLYMDGTYSTVSNYNTPAGVEELGVSITVKNDIVTAVNISNMGKDEVSVKLQNLFIDGVGSLVNGIALSEISDLGPVNGSSLTPMGFNKALATLKADATS
jgi:hypothetical protein